MQSARWRKCQRKSSASLFILVQIQAGPPWNFSIIECCEFVRKSHLDGIREESVTPLVQGPHEVRLGVDCSTFAIAPFSSVGIERKVLHVVFAGLFPMIDRQRLTIVLAIETGSHAFYATRLSPMVLREHEHHPHY